MGISSFFLLSSQHIGAWHFQKLLFDFYCMLPCLYYLEQDLFRAVFSIFFFFLTLNWQMENSNKDEFCTTALFSIFTNPICSHFLSCLFIYLTLVHPKRLLAPTGRLCMLSASVTPLPQSPSDTHLTSLPLCLPLATPAPSHGLLLPPWRRVQVGSGHLREVTHHSQLIMAIVLVWVLHFTVQCSWKGAFATPYLSPPNPKTLPLTLPHFPSLPLSGHRSPADIFTSAPSSISHLQCPPMPASIVEGSKLMAERRKSRLESKSGEWLSSPVVGHPGQTGEEGSINLAAVEQCKNNWKTPSKGSIPRVPEDPVGNMDPFHFAKDISVSARYLLPPSCHPTKNKTKLNSEECEGGGKRFADGKRPPLPAPPPTTFFFFFFLWNESSLSSTNWHIHEPLK